MGKVALVTDQFPQWNINQALVVFRPKPNLSSEYLYYFLREGELVRSVAHQTKGSVGQVNISLTQCRESILKIPSYEEQLEIVERIKNLFEIVDGLETEFTDSESSIDQLDQSILAKAFRGQLVPQDPTDEPASHLLARIRTEREAAAKATQKTRTGTKTAQTKASKYT